MFEDFPSIPFRTGDLIRLTQETAGTPPCSEGEVIGWYTNEPELVLVRLWDGGVQKIPVDSAELVRRAENVRRWW